jgi:hypothetical protein
MAVHEMIVTDVTCYGASLFCVAGWDINSGMMLRPEPPNANTAIESSRFWGNLRAGPGRPFDVGNLVRFDAAPPPANFPFPHATEDMLLAAGQPITVLNQLTLSQVAQTVTLGVAASLPAAFGGVVTPRSGKAYVPAGHVGRSLGAIDKLPNQVVLHENNYDPRKPKLRAFITDGGTIYDLPVTAEAARSIWIANGLAGLNAALQACTRVHVRLGLSRPFPAMPNECYVQINGLYFL